MHPSSESSDTSDDDSYYAHIVQQSMQYLQEPRKQWGGSRIGRSPNVNRNGTLTGHDRIYNDYFGPAPTYSEKTFRRRFRLPSAIVKRLLQEIPTIDSYFIQKADCTGKLGGSALQKVVHELMIDHSCFEVVGRGY